MHAMCYGGLCNACDLCAVSDVLCGACVQCMRAMRVCDEYDACDENVWDVSHGMRCMPHLSEPKASRRGSRATNTLQQGLHRLGLAARSHIVVLHSCMSLCERTTPASPLAVHQALYSQLSLIQIECRSGKKIGITET